ncbi:MAG TPA: CARDB domain-containing protein [Anaerolineales bacterium]|nr:CARDB domain-containing protein [Anaerolineales bacterium]
MKLRHLMQILLILVLSACGRGVNATPTPVSSLPDLVVSNVTLGMQGVPRNWTQCVPAYGPYVIQAMIRNQGNADTYDISVVELSTDNHLTIGELGAGQSVELYFPPTSADATYNVVVDPQNTIPESSENNNTFSYLTITPTPPALCTSPSDSSPNRSTPVPTEGSESAALSQTILFNGVYRSPDWGEFQLADAIYYRTPPTSQESPESYTTRIQAPVFYGDINADGLEDALVILNTQNGGSGHFIELAAVLNQNGSAYNISTIYLGDRVVIESGRVENGTIILNMRVQGPNDGLCCPSQLVTWNFVLDGDQLIKLP